MFISLRFACSLIILFLFFVGRPAFFDTSLTSIVTYLGSEWRNNPITKSDISVDKLLLGSQGYEEERKKKLVEILNIVENGKMHLLSDGQRQSVQIAMGVMKQFKVLLMDETTVECDLLVRRKLLQFLKEESEGPTRATVLYATHVFDLTSDWPTHIMHICNGTIKLFSEIDKVEQYQSLLKNWNPMKGMNQIFEDYFCLFGSFKKGSPLCELVSLWLEEEFEEKKKMKSVQKEKTLEEKLANDRREGDRFYNYVSKIFICFVILNFIS